MKYEMNEFHGIFLDIFQELIKKIFRKIDLFDSTSYFGLKYHHQQFEFIPSNYLCFLNLQIAGLLILRSPQTHEFVRIV